MRALSISKSKLRQLYERDGLSTYAIADRYECDPKTIYRHLLLNNIQLRPRKRITLSKEQLAHLYVQSRKSLKEVADAYGYSPAGIMKKLKEYGIPRRSTSETSTKHEKHDFAGTQTEKAYIIGFRLGDLGVRKMKQLVYVSSGTTKIAQADLIKSLFSPYGPVWIGKKNKKGAFNVSCSLNSSFSFLLPKHEHIPRWILSSRQHLLSFLAGYTDAEGNFAVAGGTARFRLRSCDQGILEDLHVGLERFGFNSTLQIDRVARTTIPRLNKDCWNLAINAKHDLLKLFINLLPLLRHEKRIADARLAWENVKSRTQVP